MKSVIYLILLLCTCSLTATDLDVKVSFVPNLMPFEDKLYFVYELVLSNKGTAPLEITGLEVRDGTTDALITSYDHRQIQIRYLNQSNAASGQTSLGSGIKGFVFVWVEFQRGSLPRSVKNVVLGKDSGTPFAVSGSVIPVPTGSPVVIGSPFKGGNWVAAGGPSPTSLHRTAVIPIEGPVFLAQRFAIDWISVNNNGKAFRDDGAKNEDWYCYNTDLLAVADGIVIETKQDLPENIPGYGAAYEINKETIMGNHLILQIADTLYVLYAHMIPNSIKVKVGEKVKKGDVLGKLGNSGNSSGPHLHLHVTNGPDGLLSEGIAYVYESFQALGYNFSPEALLSGGNVFNINVFVKQESTRTKELPLLNWIVKF